MREAIGGTWLFGLVITFIVFFASFLAVSINYAKAFNVKNEVINIVSKYEGNNSNSRNAIREYLRYQGYMVTGTCPNDYIGYDLTIDGTKVNKGKSYFCIKGEESSSNNISKKYYSVIVFFKIDLPVVGGLTNFQIKGETEAIYFPVDN